MLDAVVGTQRAQHRTSTALAQHNTTVAEVAELYVVAPLATSSMHACSMLVHACLHDLELRRAMYREAPRHTHELRAFQNLRAREHAAQPRGLVGSC